MKFAKTYNTRDIARILKLNYKIVQIWARSGYIPMAKIGRDWRITDIEFAEWYRILQEEQNDGYFREVG